MAMAMATALSNISASATGGTGQPGMEGRRQFSLSRRWHLAEAPIALCEVQGYVYEAKLKAAGLAEVLGHDKMAVNFGSPRKNLKNVFMRHSGAKKLEVMPSPWTEINGGAAFAVRTQASACSLASRNRKPPPKSKTA